MKNITSENITDAGIIESCGDGWIVIEFEIGLYLSHFLEMQKLVYNFDSRLVTSTQMLIRFQQ